MSSIFTRIINREIPSNIVFENEIFIVILDINPIKKGHILLIPKIEVDKVYDLDEVTYAELFALAKKMAKVMEINLQEKMLTLDVKRIGMAIEGFGVPHVHLHLIPLSHGNEINPEKTYKATTEELIEMRDFYLEVFKNLK